MPIDRKTEMKRFIFITLLFYAVFFTFISYSASRAYFASMAAASGNTFTAASEFPTTTPEATPTASVTPSITETPTPTVSETPTPTSGDQPGNVMLNEIQFKPTSTDEEWVEVYNAGGNAVDLTGWSIIDMAGNTRSLTSLGMIAPGTFKTLDVGNAILNNGTTETVTLRNSSSQPIDSHTFIGTSIATNQTIGKNPDGTGSWKACTAVSKNTTNNGIC